MSFPVMVDTKCPEGAMSSRVFICEQSTRVICTRHTPILKDTKHLTSWSVANVDRFSDQIQPIVFTLLFYTCETEWILNKKGWRHK